MTWHHNASYTVCCWQQHHMTACSISLMLTILELKAWYMSEHVCTACALNVITLHTSAAKKYTGHLSHPCNPQTIAKLYSVFIHIRTSKKVTCNRVKTMSVSKRQIALEARKQITTHTFVYSVREDKILICTLWLALLPIVSLSHTCLHTEHEHQKPRTVRLQ